MIKDEMNLTDLYTNPQMTYTETIDTLEDDVLLPYVIGYIPYEWFQDSNLFNWRRVTARQLYVSATTRIFLEDADQLDGMTAGKGVPYMWVARNVGTQINGLMHDNQNVWSYALAFYCGNNSTNMPQYSAIKNLDLKLIQASSSSDTKYRVRFCAMIFEIIDGEMHNVRTGIGVHIKSTNFDPYSGEIEDVTFNLSLGTGYEVSYTLNNETFKSFGITGYEIDNSVSDKSYKLFIYCSGIDCYQNNISFNPPNASKTYVSGMTIAGTRFRYIPKIGDTYNYDIRGGGSFFIPLSNTGGNGSGCGIYFPYRSSEFSYNYWVNRKDAVTPIVEMSSISYVNNDNFIITLDSVSGSILVNSYTYQDCVTMSFLSAPCIIHDSKLYTPELDEDYKLTGNWVEVTDENRNVNPDTNTFDPATIPTPQPTPDSGIDDNDKGTGTNLPNLNRIRSIGAGGFMSYYLLSMSGLLDIEAGLKNAPSTFWEAIGTATDTKMTNLLQYISSLKWYPIDILSGNYGYYPDATVSDITFGFSPDAKFSFSTSQYKLGSTIRVYNMGSISIPYKLGRETFLDKDPYTSIQVWLPFCGLYPIKSDYVIGNTITFTYIIDLVTGMCTAIVTNDRNTLLNVTGKIGVDYAVTGNDIITQSERMSGAYINGALSAISGGISLGANVASGNVAGSVVSGSSLLGNIAKSSIDIASAKRAVPQAVSSGSGFGSAFAPEVPCIIANPPAVIVPDTYGHTVGYVYSKTARIGSLTGYTVCDNPDLSGISATKSELDMIRQILTTGFYV